MIEWTICENCGKILDANQNTCPHCGSITRKTDISFLKDYYFKVSFLIKTIDITDFDILKDDFPQIYAWKSKNYTLESALVDDMLNWFGNLALSDNNLTDSELEFINTFLDANYTKEDILNLKDASLPDLPKSFKFLHEQDEFKKRIDLMDEEYAEELYDVYNLTGKFFITVNGKLDEDALKRYKDYLKSLRSSLDKYKSGKIVSKIDVTEAPVELKPGNTDKPEEVKQTTIDDYLDELNKLVGLDNVKKDVNSLINLVQIRKIRQERGIKQPSMSLHLVFSGNPGTGKTTVARILSKIYAEIGILSKGHLVETDRSGLVGGYVGQTAIKTQDVIQSALGGILFIDEAYSLANTSENDYGHEAIDTILKAMEDKREDLIVIVAGYPDLMEKFLHSNPGLESRFNKYIYFDDYDGEELYKIFKSMCEDSSLKLDDEADEYLKSYFNEMYLNRSDNFANGRAVRNLFEKVLTSQANRLVSLDDLSDDDLNTLTYDDFADLKQS